MSKKFKIKTKYINSECELQKAKYSVDDSIALILTNNGQKVATCSINVEDANLEKDEVVIKNYGENKGMFQALIDAGIIKDSGKVIIREFGTHTISHPFGILIKQKK